MNKNICDAEKNNRSRCIISTNTKKYIYQNKKVYLCKIHANVMNNDRLKIYEDKQIFKTKNIQNLEKINNDMKSLNIEDNNYDNFCGKINIYNLYKMLSLYKHILITGSTGIGKTLSIDLMFNKKIYDIIYYEDGNLEHFLKNSNNKSVKNKEKVIVVDNIEELDIKEINHILKLNILNKNIFIILICNNEYINHKDLKIVKSYFHEFKFITPSIQEIFVFVKNICSKNRINITDNKINKLIVYKQKDIRSIINEIIFFKDNINNTCISKKNIKQNIFDDFNEITKKIELQEKIIILEKTDCLDLMLHENYCNDKYTNIDNINKISGKISLCDTFICREIPDNYEIRKYLLLAFDNINIKGNINFPSYFNNESKRKRKKENIKDLYYNYKKINLSTTLSIEEFIEYNKKLKM